MDIQSAPLERAFGMVKCRLPQLDILNMRGAFLTTLVAFTSLLVIFLLWHAAVAADRIEIVREDLAVVGDYRFATEQKVIYEDGVQYDDMHPPLYMETILIVYKGGREIHRMEGWRWEISDRDPKPGTDVTGDGSLDVILTEYSGGAHCCFTTYIFELRGPLNMITLYTGDGGASFEDLDELPGLEIVVSDDNFTYWINGFAGSPFPQVVLRYTNGTYQLDLDLTWQPRLAESNLLRLATEVKNGEWHLNADYLPDDFLSVITDLIYAGHFDQALEFIELAWPPNKPAQDEFVAELFQCRLRRSEYWPAIAELNHLAPEQPLAGCKDDEYDYKRPWIVRSR